MLTRVQVFMTVENNLEETTHNPMQKHRLGSLKET